MSTAKPAKGNSDSKTKDKADAAQAKADAKDSAAADKFAADEAATEAQTEPPAGVEDIKRSAPPPNERLLGKYDFAPVSNALNNVLNLRNIPGLSKADLLAEFEAQLAEILDASAVTPEKWNKTVDRDSQEPGGQYAGNTQ